MLYGFLKLLYMARRYFTGVMLVVFGLEWIIYPTLILAMLNFIMQMWCKCSPCIARFSNLLPRLNSLSAFYEYTTQMQIQSLDTLLGMIDFYTIAVGTRVPV